MPSINDDTMATVVVVMNAPQPQPQQEQYRREKERLSDDILVPSEIIDIITQATPRDGPSLPVPGSNGLVTHLDVTVDELRIISPRYLRKSSEDGKTILETPEQMFARVAYGAALVEKTHYEKTDAYVLELSKKFYELLSNRRFVPGGRILANVGTSHAVVPNCVVLNIKDDLYHIKQTELEATLLQQLGSGVGYNFDGLRPAGEITKRTCGKASGPCSFLMSYNYNFSVVQQQNRHGANMAIMSVDHPDILEFVHIKEKEGTMKNFNISVSLTEEFMRAYEETPHAPWKCKFNGKEYDPRIIKRDEHNTVTSITPVQMTVAEMMREVATYAWTNGEPGVVFLDTVNAVNPVPGLGRIRASNPCGEQFLHDGDICNLGSYVYSRLRKTPAGDSIDYKLWTEDIELATRFMDNIIDLCDFPECTRVAAVCRGNRRIGSGIMGFHTLCIQLGIPYSSAEGRAFAEHLSRFQTDESWRVSYKLAEEKGPFPNVDKSIWANAEKKPRNCAVTNVPPTGTTAMTVSVSSGIEPYFSLAYVKRNVLDGKAEFININEYLKKDLMKRGLFTVDVIKKLCDTGSVQGIEEIPQDLRDIYVTAMDMSPTDHIKMQAAFQANVCNAISKTINMPNSATKEDVEKAYVLAWKLKCKGLTVYRDGSRFKQILNNGVPESVVAKLIKEVTGEEHAQKQGDAHQAQHPPSPQMSGKMTTVTNTTVCELHESLEYHKEITGKNGEVFVEASIHVDRTVDIDAEHNKIAETVTVKKSVHVPESCVNCRQQLRRSEGCLQCPNPGCGYAVCEA